MFWRLAILVAVAEMEKELTVERVRDGIRKAKLCGTRTDRDWVDQLV